MAMAPMDCTGWSSNTGLKVVPPLLDFHTPPRAAPTNGGVLPEPSPWAAMAAMRPLMAAEPMLRALRPETVPESNGGAAGASAAKAGRLASASSAAQQVVRIMAGSLFGG